MNGNALPLHALNVGEMQAPLEESLGRFSGKQQVARSLQDMTLYGIPSPFGVGIPAKNYYAMEPVA